MHNPPRLLFLISILILTSGFLALPTMAVAAGVPSIRFNRPPRDFAQPTPAVALAVGDLNGDGFPDVVTVDGYGGGSVRLGSGTGLLSPALGFASGQDSRYVAVADVNGDGRQDVIVVNSSSAGTITVLPGNGDGTLGKPVSYPAGSDPSGIAVADINHDGLLDVVLGGAPLETSGKTDDAYVLLGIPGGGFASPASIGIGQNCYFPALADLNGDGTLDLLCAADGDLSVSLGKGDGSFESPAFFGIGDRPIAISLGDVNGDGKLDAVLPLNAASGFNSVAVLLGAGDGTFGPVSNIEVKGNLSGVALADLTGDFGQEIVLTVLDSIQVFSRAGDGTFEETFESTLPYGGAVAIADLNGDGRPDVICANQSIADLSVFLNGSGGKLVVPEYYPGTYSTGIAVGDVNGDGIPDVVGLLLSGASETLLGLGNGYFAAPIYSPAGTASRVALGDFNNDGKSDLVVPHINANFIDIFLSNSDGTFLAKSRLISESNPLNVVTADLNGDGNTDLVAGYIGTGLTVYLGNGDGTFRRSIRVACADAPSPFLAIADMNGDGIPDVICGSAETGKLEVLFGLGDGTFAPAVVTSVPVLNNFTVGDLNNDGKQDLLIGAGNTVQAYLGHGDGTFQSEASAPVGFNIVSVLAADLNRDGIQDAIALTQGNNMLVLLGNGDGTFQGLKNGSVYYGLPGGVFNSVVADMNGDGVPDVVVEGSGVSVFLSEAP